MLTPHMRPESKRLDPLDERWLLVERIVTSACFRKSPRLCGFLRHIASASLQGRTEELTERQIGVDVFSRSANYNPGDDSIVRASARLLRGRLDQYFLTEGAESPWIVRVPRGTYIPVFEERCFVPTPSVSPDVSQRSEAPPARQSFSRLLPRWTVVMSAVALLLMGLTVSLLWRSHRQHAHTQFAALWNSLFAADQRTLIVPADTTLFTVAGTQETPLKLSEYLNHRATSGAVQLTETSYLSKQYTSIADLNIAFRIGRLEETQGKRIEIRYARNLTLDDAKSANLILLGGVRSNPWTQLYEDRLDYSVHSDNLRNLASATIRKPVAGEQQLYEIATSGDSAMGFGLVAMVPGISGRGHTLLIEGTNMAGTEAACDYVLDPIRFQQLAKHVVDGEGKIHNFEALLMTNAVQGSSSESHLLSLRPLP